MKVSLPEIKSTSTLNQVNIGDVFMLRDRVFLRIGGTPTSSDASREYLDLETSLINLLHNTSSPHNTPVDIYLEAEVILGQTK